jgi:glycosyltransferase involved in cell wall biosynthesis
MRFLWITREAPFAPTRGDLIYTNGIVRSLVAAGATGTMVTYQVEGVGDPNIPGLTVAAAKPPRHIRALSLLSTLPSDAYRLQSRELSDLIRRHLTDDVDTVLIDFYAMGWVLPVVQEIQRRRQRPFLLVYVSHNYEADVRMQVAQASKNPILRPVLTADARKAGRLERTLVEAAGLVTANTDDDRAEYLKLSPGKPIITLVPGYSGVIAPTKPITAERPKRVVMVGAFVWIAKRESLRHFVAAAEEPFRKAGIELLVVGKVPDALKEEIAAKYTVCKFAGWVDDVRATVETARMGAMPDEVGGGFKHKYLEYIFAGLPVAAIRSQAAGLPLDVERDMMPADDIAGLVDTVVKNIDDIPKLDAMRERAWTACAKAFDWADRGARLRETVDAMLAQPAPK